LPPGQYTKVFFTLTVQDPEATVGNAREISAQCLSINDPPRAAPRVFHMTDADVLAYPRTLGVLRDARDPDVGSTFSVWLWRAPRTGTLILTREGGLIYKPAPGRIGWVTFQFRINDGHGGVSELITFAIHVWPGIPPRLS
jgi:hypothetical protein